MTELSPAAQAVLTASAKAQCLYEWSTVNDPPYHPSDQEWNGCGDCVKRPAIAAALRAAADQVVPLTPKPDDTFCCPPVETIVWRRQAEIRRQFLAIAAELEAFDD